MFQLRSAFSVQRDWVPIVASLAVSIGSFLITPVVASAAVPQNGQFVTYDLSNDELTPLFIDGGLRQLHGEPVHGSGCLFKPYVSGRTGEAPIGQASVALNVRTCTMIIRQGHLSALPPHAAQKLASVNPALSPGKKKPAGDPCSSGMDDIWQTDPVNIVVNDSMLLPNPCWDGTSITQCITGYDNSYYSYSGWYVIGGPTVAAVQPDAQHCKSTMYYYLGNDTFRCPQQASTRTDYAYNEYWTSQTGGYWDNSSFSTWGECSSLLTWHHTVTG